MSHHHHRVRKRTKITKMRKYSKVTEAVSYSDLSNDDDDQRRAHSSKCPNDRQQSSSTSSTISSSSTDLSSPPRSFPKRETIKPGEKAAYQIRLKKSRWEPMSVQEENQRLKVLKKAKKKLKKKKNKKGKARKELIDNFHHEKDHFRPLTHFLKDRNLLAEELLDSIDLETRYEIFPECQHMTDVEIHELVCKYLKGMSKKRILAIMKGNNLSESSSTETEAGDEFEEKDEKLSNGRSSPIFEKMLENGLADRRNEKQEMMRSSANDDRIKKRPKLEEMHEKNSTMAEQLEEGEILSEADSIEQVKNIGQSSIEEANDMEEEDDEYLQKLEEELLESLLMKRKSKENKRKIDKSEIQQLEEEVLKSRLTRKARKMMQEKEIHSSDIKDEDDQEYGQSIAEVLSSPERLKTEPKFIISIDCSPPTKPLVKDEMEDELESDEGVERKVVCILPPSPPVQVCIEEENLKIQQEEDEIKITIEGKKTEDGNKCIEDEREEGNVKDRTEEFVLPNEERRTHSPSQDPTDSDGIDINSNEENECEEPDIEIC